MKRWLVLLRLWGCGLLLWGCGSGSARPALTPTSGGEVHSVGEGSVVVLVRPHAVGIRVQLWIDAGAIDAASEGAPEIAALAAWIAEGRDPHHAVHARVVPDGTVLEVQSASLDEALSSLAASLSTRDPSAEELEFANQTLRERRRGRASNLLATLEVETAASLFGPTDPLGVSPFREHDAIELATVRHFLAAHYGPRRARWVVVGAVETDAVRAAVGERVLALPRADADAPLRQVITTESSSRALEESAGHAMAVLDPRPFGPHLLGGAAGLSGTRTEHRAHFSTPCGELAVVSAHGDFDRQRLPALSFALAAGTSDPGADLDAAADAERAGLRFVSRAERCATPLSAPVWAVVLGTPDPDSDHVRGHLAQIDAALLQPHPASIQHLDVDGHTTLLMLTFQGGALADPPSSHGRTAILARALSRRCGVRAEVEPEQLVLSLRIDDGTPSREDDASEFAISRALQCVLLDEMPDAFLEAARAEALAALDDEQGFLADAALALAPGTPGLIAPSGSASGLAGASDLQGALGVLRDGARLSVALISAHPPSASLTNGLGSLPRSEPPSELVASGSGPAESFVASIAAPAVEVIVTLRVDHAPGTGPADARAVALLLASELDGSSLSVVHIASGNARTASWVAIGVRGGDEAIDEVASLTAAAVERSDARLRDALQTAAEARDLAAREASGRPEALARSLLGNEPLTPDPTASRTLLHAPVHRVVVRPSTPPVRRRR